MATEGEIKTPRALTMATYLRAVVGRASERLVVPTKAARAAVAESQRDNQHDNTDDNEENQQKVTSDMEPAAVGACETASSSGTIEELVESPVQRGAGEEPPFMMRVLEPSRGDDNDVAVAGHTANLQWAYCDVLLQLDADGLGLNLSVKNAPPSLRMMETPRDVVVVASFRRLDADDVGPAEASGKIQRGDVLWAIDGERVGTLEAVAMCISRRSRAFYLMRFVRPVASGVCGGDDDRVVTHPETLPASVAVVATTDQGNAELRPDVALLIRELVVRNQSLEEQLLASRLKQDEQRIQLDQLHALYAKTQLENWPPVFSLPKPFSRRGTLSSESVATAAKTARSVLTFTAAAERLMGANAMQYDVEFAVDAERERLTRQFTQQLEDERKDLQTAYDAKLAALCVASDKKIRMLEFAMKELLSTPMLRGDEADGDRVTPTEYPPHVLALRHQLFHRAKEGLPTSRTTHADCLLCLLEKECADAVLGQPTGNQEEWRVQLTAILDEYATLKITRERLLEEMPVATASSGDQVTCGDDTQRVETSRDTKAERKDT